MKCPIEGCTEKSEERIRFFWVKLFGYDIFPKLWKPIVRTFYCPRHGNFMWIDCGWWWYSKFRPLIPLYYKADYMCPNKCWGNNWVFNDVHKGKDELYYCSHCNWKGSEVK